MKKVIFTLMLISSASQTTFACPEHNNQKINKLKITKTHQHNPKVVNQSVAKNQNKVPESTG